MRAARVASRAQNVRIRIAEIGVDAPATANNVLAVAPYVVGSAKTRLDVVAVRLLAEREVVQHGRDRCGQAVERAGERRLLNLYEIRIQRLVEIEAGHQIVTHAEIEGQPVTDAPVVLKVQTVLLVRDVGLRTPVAHPDRAHG